MLAGYDRLGLNASPDTASALPPVQEGRPTDLWYTSCVDLFNSRFNATDYEGLGVTGVSISGVTR